MAVAFPLPPHLPPPLSVGSPEPVGQPLATAEETPVPHFALPPSSMDEAQLPDGTTADNMAAPLESKVGAPPAGATAATSTAGGDHGAGCSALVCSFFGGGCSKCGRSPPSRTGVGLYALFPKDALETTCKSLESRCLQLEAQLTAARAEIAAAEEEKKDLYLRLKSMGAKMITQLENAREGKQKDAAQIQDLLAARSQDAAKIDKLRQQRDLAYLKNTELNCQVDHSQATIAHLRSHLAHLQTAQRPSPTIRPNHLPSGSSSLSPLPEHRVGRPAHTASRQTPHQLHPFHQPSGSIAPSPGLELQRHGRAGAGVAQHSALKPDAPPYIPAMAPPVAQAPAPLAVH